MAVLLQSLHDLPSAVSGNTRVAEGRNKPARLAGVAGLRIGARCQRGLRSRVKIEIGTGFRHNVIKAQGHLTHENIYHLPCDLVIYAQHTGQSR